MRRYHLSALALALLVVPFVASADVAIDGRPAQDRGETVFIAEDSAGNAVQPRTNAAGELIVTGAAAGAFRSNWVQTNGVGVVLGSGVVTVATPRFTLSTDDVVSVDDGTGSLTTDPGVGFGIPFATETGVTAVAPVTSTGATAATLVALTAAQIIYPTTLVCTNEDTTTDEIVEILSSVVPTVLMRFYLPAKATFVYDGRGDIRTVAGEALQFRLADAGTTVKCSGSAIKR